MFAIIGLALVVRVVAIAVDGGYAPEQDALDYHRHAVSIAAGDGFPESEYVPGGGPTALRAPGYPYALGAVYALAGESVTAGRLFNVLLGALAVLLLYAITRRIWGHATGLAAAALAAVFPPLVGAGLELFSENLMVPLLLGAVLAVLRARETGLLRWALLAGALGGAAALARGPAMVALALLALGLWTLRPRWSPQSLAAPVVALIAAALVIAPWTVRNLAEFGRFIPITTSTGFGLAGTYNEISARDDASWRSAVTVPSLRPVFTDPRADEGDLDAVLRDEARAYAADHPGYVVEVTGRNLLRLGYLAGNSVVAYGEETVEPGVGNRGSPPEKAGFAIAALLALVGVGALATARRDGRMRPMPRGPLYLWLVPIALVAVAAPVAGLPRYRIPADPFLLILAAIGLVALMARFKARRAAPAALAAALLLAGCGDGDKTPATTPTPAATADPAAKAQFVREADRICRQALADARRVADRFGRAPGSDLQRKINEHLIKPGIESRERQATALRELERPSGDDESLDVFLGLFDATAELGRLRLAAGRAGRIEEAKRYEGLINELAFEQRRAAREYGMRDCATDPVSTAFG